MPNPRTRVVGSGNTQFRYRGKTVLFLEQVEDSGQRAFSDAGAPFQFIQPIGYEHPIEIATSRVLQGGTLNLTIRELWNLYVWEHLAGLTGSRNIVDIFRKLAEDPSYVTCTMLIKPPGNIYKPRGKTYMNCVVTDIADNDTVTVGGLAVTKGITIAYTHTKSFTG